MKRLLQCLLLLGVIGIGVFLFFLFRNKNSEKKLEEIKKGWYIEIIYDSPINVRKEANANSAPLGVVKKGEIYKVLDIDLESSNTYFWYKIDFNGEEGWVASGRKRHWVNDYNNPTDIMTPEITFESNTYNVRSIDDINYKHLTVIEDKPNPKITHVIYHEKDKDQYWILYTITDAAGKSSSKMQRIIFEIKPDEDRVLDFKDYKK